VGAHKGHNAYERFIIFTPVDVAPRHSYFRRALEFESGAKRGEVAEINP
jgi:hypothetical protein